MGGSRRAAEGTVAAAVRDERERLLVEQYASTLPELERPLVAVLEPERLDAEALESAFGFSRFDFVLCRDLFFASADPRGLLSRIAAAVPGALFLDGEILPRRSGGLVSLAEKSSLAPGPLARLADFEAAFYARDESPPSAGRKKSCGWLCRRILRSTSGSNSGRAATGAAFRRRRSEPGSPPPRPTEPLRPGFFPRRSWKV